MKKILKRNASWLLLSLNDGNWEQPSTKLAQKEKKEETGAKFSFSFSFSLFDINCSLVVKFNDYTFKYFNNENELKRMLDGPLDAHRQNPGNSHFAQWP